MQTLQTFIPTVSKTFTEPKHLKALTDIIELSETTALRECVSVSPRHGKTETLMHGIAYLLKKDPSLQCAYITNAGNLAKSKSRRAKMFAEQAGLELAKGSKAVHEWRTPQGGGLLATSIGGPLTGHGVDFMVVDDPYKNRQEAESETVRETVWDWFINVAYTRLEPGASCIINMARWHEDDLIGRLLSIEHASPWHGTTLPALLDGPLGVETIPLWPEKFSVEHLLRIRQQVGSYVWESLYQGRPSAREGNVFKRVWFDDSHRYSDLGSLGDLKHRVLSVDGAWKDGVGNDYSCLQVWDWRGKNNFALVDNVKLRLELPDLINAIIYQATRYNPNVIAIENSASGIGALQVLRRETTLPVVAVQAVGQSKEQKAESVAPLFQAGVTKFPRGAPWLTGYVDEFCAFPNAKHDDQVDASYLALNRLQQVSAGNVVDLFGYGSRGHGFASAGIFGR